MTFTIGVVDGAGNILSERTGSGAVCLVQTRSYQPQDSIVLQGTAGQHILLSLDDALPPALLFMTDAKVQFPIPFAEQAKGFSAKAFSGDLHRLAVRAAFAHDLSARRNLAFNPFDFHANDSLFPHAQANAETRGEAAFAARCAIDGEYANDGHGIWPYTSWGINRDPAAVLEIDLGREVLLDEVALTLRADFPHDAWWQSAGLTFDDRPQETVALVKTAGRQGFRFPPQKVRKVVLHDLCKADDPSPYPALTQIEVMGTDIAETTAAAA